MDAQNEFFVFWNEKIENMETWWMDFDSSDDFLDWDIKKLGHFSDSRLFLVPSNRLRTIDIRFNIPQLYRLKLNKRAASNLLFLLFFDHCSFLLLLRKFNQCSRTTGDRTEWNCTRKRGRTWTGGERDAACGVGGKGREISSPFVAMGIHRSIKFTILWRPSFYFTIGHHQHFLQLLFYFRCFFYSNFRSSPTVGIFPTQNRLIKLLEYRQNWKNSWIKKISCNFVRKPKQKFDDFEKKTSSKFVSKYLFKKCVIRRNSYRKILNRKLVWKSSIMILILLGRDEGGGALKLYEASLDHH